MDGPLATSSPIEDRSTKVVGMQKDKTSTSNASGKDGPRCLTLKRRMMVFARAKRVVKWVPLSPFWLPDVEIARRLCEQKLQIGDRKRKASESFLETCREYDKWVFNRSAVNETENNGLEDHSGAKAQKLEETSKQEQPTSSRQSTAPSTTTFSAPFTTGAVVPAPSGFVFGVQPSFGQSNPTVGYDGGQPSFGASKPFQFGIPSSNVPALPSNTFGANSLTPFPQPPTFPNPSGLPGVAPSFSAGPMQPPGDGNQIFAFNPASFSNTAKRSTYSRRRRR